MSRLFDIITDSTCDMAQEYYAENNVACAPLSFILDGVVYGNEEGEQMDEKVFYEKLRQGAMPVTSQINRTQAESYLRSSLSAQRDVLVLGFSSGLSGSVQSFFQAAKDLAVEFPERKIIVVDSLCASMGEGLLLDYVIRKADSGASIEETAAYAEELKPHICHFFTVDNLFHLQRGGRVSKATAIVGTMLKIKPVLHVDNDGHLIAIGKAMGRKKSIQALVDHMAEERIPDADEPVFISHADCAEDAEYLAGLVREKFGAERRIVIHMIGAVIGSHAGCGTLALFFRGKQR